MAELTPLDEKLGEVLGLAMAAQDATRKVAGMEGADDFKDELERMGAEAAETQERTERLVATLEGKKTAIQEKGRETKGEAVDMMKTYLADEEEALDGFEFLAMAEAGELCHWEIVETMSRIAGEQPIQELADSVLGVQRRHVETVRGASLRLAEEEARELVG